ncbi:MAG: hypothetical protein H0V25_08910, partial [Solirubrobacterales bacterium]|nr:hypothetical protein [Solirubrobacterales bacterium]
MHRLLAGAVLMGIALALALLFGGAGFLNYDTTFALVWGREIAGGVLPDFEAPLAPTPHPLATQIGISLSPLSGAGPSGGAARGALAEQVVVVAAYLLLGALGWVVFRLGQHWFGWPAGVLAAAIVLTREPVLSFGLRAYVDIGYLVLVLGALLV